MNIGEKKIISFVVNGCAKSNYHGY